MTYVVAYTPRSGSWLLTHALDGAGAGRPLEYLQERYWRNAPGAAPPAQLAHLLRRATTPDGVTGLKVHWADWLATAARLGVTPLDLHARLGGPRYVLTTRRDKLRQAVSWARAKRTGQWFRFAETAAKDAGDPDPDLVRECTTRLADLEDAWRDHFAAVGAEVREVVYEELAADYEGTARGVLNWLGLPGAAVKPPRLVRQADAETERWIESVTEK